MLIFVIGICNLFKYQIFDKCRTVYHLALYLNLQLIFLLLIQEKALFPYSMSVGQHMPPRKAYPLIIFGCIGQHTTQNAHTHIQRQCNLHLCTAIIQFSEIGSITGTRQVFEICSLLISSHTWSITIKQSTSHNGCFGSIANMNVLLISIDKGHPS